MKQTRFQFEVESEKRFGSISIWLINCRRYLSLTNQALIDSWKCHPGWFGVEKAGTKAKPGGVLEILVT
jgi:hypothetical protein